MSRKDKYENDGRARDQAEKLAKVVRALSTTLRKFRAEHLPKKTRRLLEDAMEVFWTSPREQSCYTRRRVAKLIVCAFTGIRPWDVDALPYNDARVVAVDDALRRENSVVAYRASPAGPAAKGHVRGASPPDYGSQWPAYVSDKDRLREGSVAIPDGPACLDESLSMEVDVPEVAPAAGAVTTPQVPLLPPPGPSPPDNDTDPDIDLYELGMC